MSLIFRLPPKGSLIPNGDDDPLKYYYIPLVGSLYTARINIALDLLQNRGFSTTLEIGYGSGVLMPTLCQLSDRVYGVDIGSEPEVVATRLKKLNCYPKLTLGKSDRLLFDERSFDLVVAISVLEHIRPIEPFLTEIYRVLKPNGLLLVGMPAVNKTMEYLFRAIGFSGIEQHHVTSPEDMVKATKSMFKIEAVSWMPKFMPSNIYLYKAFLLKKR